MSFGKELLLFCIGIGILLVDSQLFKLETIRENMKNLEPFAFFCDLQKAEEDYVKHVFQEEGPNALKLIEGITLGNTTEEINASSCAINDYLGKHLQTILENVLTSTWDRNSILNRTQKFLNQFNKVVGQNETLALKQCHRNVTVSDCYTMRVRGLKIINSTRRWAETIAVTKASCMKNLN